MILQGSKSPEPSSSRRASPRQIDSNLAFATKAIENRKSTGSIAVMQSPDPMQMTVNSVNRSKDFDGDEMGGSSTTISIDDSGSEGDNDSSM